MTVPMIPTSREEYVPTDVEGVWAFTDPPASATYTVMMELQVEASSPEEASDLAMRWRDAVGLHADTNAALDRLPHVFHLHHPWGC